MSLARPLLARIALPPAITGGTAMPDALAAVTASALPAGSTWRGVTVAVRPGTNLGDAAARAGVPAPAAAAAAGAAGAAATAYSDARGRIVSGLAAGIAEPSVVPDGTVSLAPPSQVLGPRAATLLTDGLRAAATAAKLAVPAAGSDQAAAATGLDTLASAAAGRARPQRPASRGRPRPRSPHTSCPPPSRSPRWAASWSGGIRCWPRPG